MFFISFPEKFWFIQLCRIIHFVRPSDTQKLRLIKKFSTSFSSFLPFYLGHNSHILSKFKIQILLSLEQLPRNHSDRHLLTRIASLLHFVTSPNRQLHYKFQLLPETLITKTHSLWTVCASIVVHTELFTV